MFVLSCTFLSTVDLLHLASTAVKSAHELQRHGINAKGRSRVGDFLRVGNDDIQPLEKSSSNPLICNERNFNAYGLQNFDATRGERRSGRRERNGALNGVLGQQAKSAGFRKNPRKHAGSRNKKGQPRAVDLYILVEAARIEHASAARPPYSFLHAYSGAASCWHATFPSSLTTTTNCPTN